jgi:rhodanese-related sulfurtransferase
MEAALRDFFISCDELKGSIGTAEAPVVVDVRRRERYAEDAHVLPTARWRDHTRVAEWGKALAPGASVVCVCVHGHNVSQLAAAGLREMGLDARVLAGGIEAWKQAGAPTIRKAALPGRDEDKPSCWVTRVRPKIDRIACPWLIRRFIDREARFHFVEPAYVAEVAKEAGAIAYDIDGIELSHSGPLCTFDTLLRRFGLSDPALDALATIIRGADTARMELAPQAAGLLAVSLGISALSGGDDHAALERGFPVYDALYAWQRHAAGETHNWPAKSA